MKRFLIVAVLLGIAAMFGLVSLVSLVNAQDTEPPAPPAPPAPGQGYGRWGDGPGMMGGYARHGAMHEDLLPALADALGLTVEALEERHANGETFWQIAEAQGYTFEEARQMMLDARSAALDAMVEDGLLSEDRAEWMKDRSGRMSDGGAGHGRGGCMNGAIPNPEGADSSRGRGGRGR